MAPPRKRRPGFSRRAQYSLFLAYVIAVAGALVGAALLAISTFDPATFSLMRAGVAEFTAPVSSAGAAISRGIASVPANVSSYFLVRRQNVALRRELSDAHALLLRARALSYDNDRLKALLHLRERETGTVVAARIVSSSPSSARRYALLNAGSWQGVRSGEPVRGPEGLIGRVIETGPNTARVMLLTDAESIVPVRRARDGLAALAAGRGDGLIDIRSVVVADAAFSPGDVFVTSGTGGMYAPNIPVAKILRHARDIALARPLAQPSTLDFALVEQSFMPAATMPPSPTPHLP